MVSAPAVAERSPRVPVRGRVALGATPILLAIVVLGVALRLFNLASQSLWSDEIAAIAIARQPLHVLWSSWMVRETNPPLYYSALHVWMLAFGASDGAVRSLSVLVGSLAAPLMYGLGKAMGSKRIGLIAALFTALWCHQIYYSQEARGYIFGVVGALIAVIGLVRISDQTVGASATGTPLTRFWPYAAYGLGAVGAIYTHTTHVLLPVLANLYFVWLWALRSPRRVSPLFAWTATNAVVVGLWAWWGWITWLQMHLEQPNFGWIGKPSPSQGLSVALTVYGPAGVTLAKSLGRSALLGIGGLFIAAAAFGATRLRLERAVLLAVFGIGAPLLLFVVSQKVPILLPRTLLWAQFSVIIGLAAAVAAVQNIVVRTMTTAVIAGLLILGWFVEAPREPWRPLIAELSEQAGPDDAVLVSSVSDGVYVQHYCVTFHCRFHLIDVTSPADTQNRWAESLFKGGTIKPAALPGLLGRMRTVWTVSRWGDDPRPVIAPIAATAAFAPFKTPLPSFMAVARWRRIAAP